MKMIFGTVALIWMGFGCSFQIAHAQDREFGYYIETVGNDSLFVTLDYSNATLYVRDRDYSYTFKVCDSESAFICYLEYSPFGHVFVIPRELPALNQEWNFGGYHFEVLLYEEVLDRNDIIGEKIYVISSTARLGSEVSGAGQNRSVERRDALFVYSSRNGLLTEKRTTTNAEGLQESKYTSYLVGLNIVSMESELADEDILRIDDEKSQSITDPAFDANRLVPYLWGIEEILEEARRREAQQ